MKKYLFLTAIVLFSSIPLIAMKRTLEENDSLDSNKRAAISDEIEYESHSGQGQDFELKPAIQNMANTQAQMKAQLYNAIEHNNESILKTAPPELLDEKILEVAILQNNDLALKIFLEILKNAQAIPTPSILGPLLQIALAQGKMNCFELMIQSVKSRQRTDSLKYALYQAIMDDNVEFVKKYASRNGFISVKPKPTVSIDALVLAIANKSELCFHYFLLNNYKHLSESLTNELLENSLSAAIENGHFTLAKELLSSCKRKIDYLRQQSLNDIKANHDLSHFFDTLLRKTIATQNVEILTILCNNDSHLLSYALWYCVYLKNLTTAEKLLELGANFDTILGKFFRFLHISIIHGKRWDVIEFAINAGCSIGKLKAQIPLQYEEHYEEYLSYINKFEIEYKKKKEISEAKLFSTYLTAIKDGDYNKVTDLYAKHTLLQPQSTAASVIIENLKIDLAVCLACEYGHIQILEFFIKKGLLSHCKGYFYRVPYNLHVLLDSLLSQQQDQILKDSLTQTFLTSPLNVAYQCNNKKIALTLLQYKETAELEFKLANKKSLPTPLNFLLQIYNNDTHQILLASLLNLACESQNIAVAQQLLEKNADPNFAVKGCLSPLTIALNKNDYDLAKLLLENNAYIRQMNLPLVCLDSIHDNIIKNPALTNKDIRFKDLLTHYFKLWKQKCIEFLHYCKDGNLDEVMKYLEEYNFIINESIDRKTALTYALERKNTRLIDLLLNKGAKLESSNIQALWLAFYTNDKAIILKVLAKFDLSYLSEQTLLSLLVYCLEHELSNVVDYLKDHIKNDKLLPFASIIVAIKQNNSTSLKDILNALKDQNHFPIYLLINFYNTATLKEYPVQVDSLLYFNKATYRKLIETIIDILIQVKKTDLLLALVTENIVSVFNVHFEKIISSNNLKLYSLLYPFANKGRNGTVLTESNQIDSMSHAVTLKSQLLDVGINKLKNQLIVEDTREALILQSLYNDESLRKFIVKNEQDINVEKDADLTLCKTNAYYKSKNNHTLLMVACMLGRTDIVEFLLQDPKVYEVFIDTQDKYGRTALMYAIIFGHTECAQLLIPKIKDGLNLYDNKGRSALFHAIARGNLEIIKLLLYHKQQTTDKIIRIGRAYDSAQLKAKALRIAAARGHGEVVVKMLCYYSKIASLF